MEPPFSAASHHGIAASARDPLWQHQLGLLLESTGEGIFGIDLAGHCMFINRAGAEMLGHAVADVLGHNMHAFTHHSHPDGSHYPEADCPIFNAFRCGLPCRIDTEVFWRADDTAFAVEYSSHPIMDGAEVRGAVITFVDITERRRAAQALQQAKDELGLRVEERTRELSDALAQLRELSAWLDKVREDERTRIAREVHDELGSLLVALKMDVNWIGKRLGEQQDRAPDAAEAMRQQIRGKCHNMGGLIERAVDNVGRIITDLRPSILDHQGLWAALEWQAHEFVQSAELALEWRMAPPGAGDWPEPPEPLAMAVFRIFQEMLSNVGRHAQASAIGVTLTLQTTPQGGHAGLARSLHLQVRDNGVGAPATAFEAPTAYGVLGMRERARHFGGRVDITSQPGQGSCFDLHIPLLESPAA
ncbi:MAG: two component transcriptional regulator, sensor histidine kinase [Rhodoferax sp.]|nr:two component transcriptional regulator, sensor histidine kinase [Rhodoferax sp.]